ncbi:MAG: hypothetical protein ACI86H_002737 [bacterium]|jgi:hypothetical protein
MVLRKNTLLSNIKFNIVLLLSVVGFFCFTSLSFAQVEERESSSNGAMISFFIPIQEQGTVKGSSDEVTPDTTGSSFQLILNRWGVGYTELTSKFTIDSYDHTLKSSFADLSYTWGNKVRLTTGVGYLLGGSGEMSNSNGSLESNSISGGGWFVTLDIVGKSFDYLIGYRQNQVTYKDYEGNISGQSTTLNSDLTLNTTQVLAGIGVRF